MSYSHASSQSENTATLEAFLDYKNKFYFHIYFPVDVIIRQKVQP